jgi:hypothetical protein
MPQNLKGEVLLYVCLAYSIPEIVDRLPNSYIAQFGTPSGAKDSLRGHRHRAMLARAKDRLESYGQVVRAFKADVAAWHRLKRALQAVDSSMDSSNGKRKRVCFWLLCYLCVWL